LQQVDTAAMAMMLLMTLEATMAKMGGLLAVAVVVMAMKAVMVLVEKVGEVMAVVTMEWPIPEAVAVVCKALVLEMAATAAPALSLSNTTTHQNH
jgi:hypothetical protein